MIKILCYIIILYVILQKIFESSNSSSNLKCEPTIINTILFEKPNPWIKVVVNENSKYKYNHYIRVKIHNIHSYNKWLDMLDNIVVDNKNNIIVISTHDEPSALAIINIILINILNQITFEHILNKNLINISINKCQNSVTVQNKIRQQILENIMLINSFRSEYSNLKIKNDFHNIDNSTINSNRCMSSNIMSDKDNNHIKYNKKNDYKTSVINNSKCNCELKHNNSYHNIDYNDNKHNMIPSFNPDNPIDNMKYEFENKRKLYSSCSTALPNNINDRIDDIDNNMQDINSNIQAINDIDIPYNNNEHLESDSSPIDAYSMDSSFYSMF